jgi:hypothetical protein
MVEFWSTATVIGTPRPVVVLRIAASTGARVDRHDPE